MLAKGFTEDDSDILQGLAVRLTKGEGDMQSQIANVLATALLGMVVGCADTAEQPLTEPEAEMERPRDHDTKMYFSTKGGQRTVAAVDGTSGYIQVIIDGKREARFHFSEATKYLAELDPSFQERFVERLKAKVADGELSDADIKAWAKRNHPDVHRGMVESDR